MHSAPYFAAIGLLTVFHSWNVVQLRRKHQVGIGDGGIPELARMMRVFGNHIEYAPLGLILLIGLEFVDAPVWYLHICGGALLTGRVLHAMGLSKSIGKTPARTLGVLLTWTSVVLASLGTMVFSMTAMIR